jgi:hypothetical protein
LYDHSTLPGSYQYNSPLPAAPVSAKSDDSFAVPQGQHMGQGHQRTRSEQVIPASASLWTAYTPLGAPFVPVEGTYSVAKSGFVDIHTGQPIPPPSNSLGSVGAHMAMYDGPASVPAAFAPLAHVSEYSPHAMDGMAYSTDGASSSTPSPGVGQLQLHTGMPASHTPPQTRTRTSSTAILKPFSPLRRRDSTASATRSPRQTRRESLGSSPYSPGRQPISLGQLGRAGTGMGTGVGMGNGTPAGAGAGVSKSHLETPPNHEIGLPPPITLGVGPYGEDDGLPSAGIKEMQLEPFGNLLGMRGVSEEDM